MTPRPEHDVRHEQQYHQNAGDDTRDEQARDRDLGDEAVEIIMIEAG